MRPRNLEFDITFLRGRKPASLFVALAYCACGITCGVEQVFSITFKWRCRRAFIRFLFIWVCFMT